METIADRLRALRVQKGVSQDVVAEACDLSRVALTRYECGARVPIAGNVAKLASYYGVTVDYLMGVETPPTQEMKKDIQKAIFDGLWDEMDQKEKTFIISMMKAMKHGEK